MNNKSNSLSFFGLENWKIFQQEQFFDFTNINLLVGTNNSGKSSLIEAIKLAQIIFKDFNPLSTKKLKIGKATHPLNSIIEIELPEDMEHINSFQNLINENSVDGQFSFVFKVEDILLPEKALLVKFTYAADASQPLKAILKSIVIKTIHDEKLVKILPEEVNSLQRNSASYNFKIIRNINILKSYFTRAGLIKSKIDKLLQLISNAESGSSDSSITLENEKHKDHHEVSQIIYELENEFGMNSDDLENWKKIFKDLHIPEYLMFDYIYFKKYETGHEHNYQREDVANKLKEQLGERQLDFVDIFPTLALNIEEVIFEYLWRNDISIREFLDNHLGANFNSYYIPEYDSHDGISIVRIGKESKIFDEIVKKLVEEKKIYQILKL